MQRCFDSGLHPLRKSVVPARFLYLVLTFVFEVVFYIYITYYILVKKTYGERGVLLKLELLEKKITVKIYNREKFSVRHL